MLVFAIELLVCFFQVSKITGSSGENVVLMLGRCLPHIVPNVLLAKREVILVTFRFICAATTCWGSKQLVSFSFSSGITVEVKVLAVCWIFCSV